MNRKLLAQPLWPGLTATVLGFFLAGVALGGDGCKEVEVVLEPEVDVRVAHWQFAGPVGVVVCERHAESLDESRRADLRAEYEKIIAELTLLSLRLCWDGPPDARWIESMVEEFKKPYLDRLNEVLPRAVIQELTCALGFVEYEPV